MNERTADDERFGELMRAAQAGDTEAYVALLREIAPRVRQMVQRHGGTWARDAEDVIQDALLSVHVARATYDPHRPFLPWLLAIVRHRVTDAKRRHMRRTAREVPIDDPDVTFSQVSTKSPSEPFSDRDALRTAVQTLPARQRDAIELLKLRELSLKEAATTSGMTVGALKVATHRAIAALRRILVVDESDEH
jgi:RNA polymerase sigma factor (sigma-70 family)